MKKLLALIICCGLVMGISGCNITDGISGIGETGIDIISGNNVEQPTGKLIKKVFVTGTYEGEETSHITHRTLEMEFDKKKTCKEEPDTIGNGALGEFPVKKIQQHAGNIQKETYREDDYSATIQTYEYDSSGNILEITAMDEDGTLGSEYSYEYNKKGKLTAQTFTRFSSGESQTTYYEYNSDGSYIAKLEQNDEERSVHLWYEYEFDKDGNLLKETTTSANEEGYNICYEYEYDNNGNLIKKIYYNHTLAEPTQYVSEYEYDEKRNIIKETIYEQDKNGNVVSDEVTVVKTEYEYDNDGNILKITIDGDEKSRYEYDNDGYLIKHFYTEFTGDVMVYEYSYEFY